MAQEHWIGSPKYALQIRKKFLITLFKFYENIYEIKNMWKNILWYLNNNFNYLNPLIKRGKACCTQRYIYIYIYKIIHLHNNDRTVWSFLGDGTWRSSRASLSSCKSWLQLLPTVEMGQHGNLPSLLLLLLFFSFLFYLNKKNLSSSFTILPLYSCY